MLWIEQQGQRAFAVELDVDLRNIANLELIGNRADRAVFRLQHAKGDAGIVGQDRAGPAARAERADRCQRQQLGGERQDRPARNPVLVEQALDLRDAARARPRLDLGVERVRVRNARLLRRIARVGGQGFTAAQAANAYPQLQQIAPTVLLPAFTQWQDQLTRIADVVGRSDRVPSLLQAYQDRAAQVRGALRLPPQPTVFLYQARDGKPYVITPTAALPREDGPCPSCTAFIDQLDAAARHLEAAGFNSWWWSRSRSTARSPSSRPNMARCRLIWP